jgi:hypothetical protein
MVRIGARAFRASVSKRAALAPEGPASGSGRRWGRAGTGRCYGPFQTELVSAPAFGSAVCARAADDINDIAAAARMNPERMWECMYKFRFFRGAQIAQLNNSDNPLSFLRCDKDRVDIAPTKGRAPRPAIAAQAATHSKHLLHGRAVLIRLGSHSLRIFLRR